jgi:hypothetical protein
LFTELIDHHFDRDIGLRDPEVKDYVVNVLAEFCQCEQLYKICEAGGRPLHDVGEMLLQADPVYGPAPSFDRERQVRKHIGDYTLFFSGMFPESVNHYRLRRQRLENFIDFIRAGKESYYIVSKFDQSRRNAASHHPAGERDRDVGQLTVEAQSFQGSFAAWQLFNFRVAYDTAGTPVASPR